MLTQNESHGSKVPKSDFAFRPCFRVIFGLFFCKSVVFASVLVKNVQNQVPRRSSEVLGGSSEVLGGPRRFLGGPRRSSEVPRRSSEVPRRSSEVPRRFLGGPRRFLGGSSEVIVDLRSSDFSRRASEALALQINNISEIEQNCRKND